MLRWLALLCLALHRLGLDRLAYLPAVAVIADFGKLQHVAHDPLPGQHVRDQGAVFGVE